MLPALVTATLVSLLAAGLVALAQQWLRTREGLDPEVLERAAELLQSQRRLTASELATFVGCSLHQANQTLRALVDDARYTMVIDDDEGVLRYEAVDDRY